MIYVFEWIYNVKFLMGGMLVLYGFFYFYNRRRLFLGRDFVDGNVKRGALLYVCEIEKFFSIWELM